MLGGRIASNPWFRTANQPPKPFRNLFQVLRQRTPSSIERTYLRFKRVRVANYAARTISVRFIGVNVMLNISDPCFIVSQCLVAGVVAAVVF